MPIPFIIAGIAAVAGIAGVAKGAKAVSNNSQAKDIITRANDIYDEAKQRLEEQKEITTTQLNTLAELKLKVWSEDIGDLKKVYKQFKNVRFESKVQTDTLLGRKIQEAGSFKQMEVASLRATEVLKAGTSSLGAGALAGIATYGGAMMFASASTGTAISALSGVAATNATMAWFGGGSLAAGGLGMAGGAAVLGGIVVGPVLAVAGFIMAAKSEENLSKARKTLAEAQNAAEKMDTIILFLNAVEELADSYETFIEHFRKRYRHILNEVEDMAETESTRQKKRFLNRIKSMFGVKKSMIDFNLLNRVQQNQLHILWLSTQVFNAVLSAPLLTKDGDIEEDARKVLESAVDSSVKLLSA